MGEGVAHLRVGDRAAYAAFASATIRLYREGHAPFLGRGAALLDQQVAGVVPAHHLRDLPLLRVGGDRRRRPHGCADRRGAVAAADLRADDGTDHRTEQAARRDLQFTLDQLADEIMNSFLDWEEE